jgi:hypothetical protein
MIRGGVRVPLHSLERAIELAGGHATESYLEADYCIVGKDAVYEPWMEKFTKDPKKKSVPIVQEDVRLTSRLNLWCVVRRVSCMSCVSCVSCVVSARAIVCLTCYDISGSWTV